MKPGPPEILDSAVGVCRAWGNQVYSSNEVPSP
jgi:hypothetical protein